MDSNDKCTRVLNCPFSHDLSKARKEDFLVWASRRDCDKTTLGGVCTRRPTTLYRSCPYRHRPGVVLCSYIPRYTACNPRGLPTLNRTVDPYAPAPRLLTQTAGSFIDTSAVGTNTGDPNMVGIPDSKSY